MSHAENATALPVSAVTLADVLVAQALAADGDDDLVVRIGRAAAAHQADEGALLDAGAAELELVGRDLPGLLDRFKAEALESEHLTPGAKRLLGAATQLEPALRTVVSDKVARGVLRGQFDVDVGELRRMGDAPLGPRATRRRRTWGGDAVVLADMDMGEACAHFEVEFRLLDEDVELAYRSKGEPRTVSLPEFVASLAEPAGRPRMNGVCQSLLSGRGNRGILLVIYAAWLDGKVQLHRRLEAQFRVFCIRALLAMNAAESAYQEAVALEAEDLALRYLPQSEHQRLLALIARAAVRSGRVDRGRQRYTQLFVRDTSDVTAYRELLGSCFSQDPALARSLCRVALDGELTLQTRDLLFVADLLRGDGAAGDALALLQSLRVRDGDPDVLLGIANVGIALGDPIIWRTGVEQFFAEQRLPVAHVGDTDAPAPFGFGGVTTDARPTGPLVTVVMTTFDAAATVRSSIASVQAQTVANWELIVVDDGSTDDTRAILDTIAAGDERVKILSTAENGGTYLAKNQGIRVAEGAFVTFHDSDDWMHPQRLERHLAATPDDVACTVSRWIRMDSDGLSVVRRGGPYTHLNPASTFFRKAALDAVGLFDGVRTGADAELVARVRANLGWDAVRELDDCLGIGLHHDASLTQSGATAFDEFRYSPVRLAYTETWLRWHVLHLADGETVYNAGTRERPYPIPAEISP